MCMSWVPSATLPASTDCSCGCDWRRYFGAAKQLPGVRELFEREPPRQIRRTRHQMYAHINADYYGFRDEEDGILEKVEAAAEREIRDKVRGSFGGADARPCAMPQPTS